jgi:hypothetical protein
VAIDSERAKVMFFMWIIAAAKVIVDFDGLDDAHDCFGTEGGHAWRHNGVTITEVVPQFVVECTNAQPSVSRLTSPIGGAVTLA